MTSSTGKPPVPGHTFGGWPRIPVDTGEGSRHYEMTRIGRRAATEWILGPAGPYKNPTQTMAQTIRGAVGEALLHLMELGLIDVDVARLESAHGIPWARKDFRPDREPPQHIGDGANAEDCPACEGTNPPYPFICPGPKEEPARV
jgi:hypothetical protein